MKRYLPLLPPLLAVAYAVRRSPLPNALSLPALDITQYKTFTDEFRFFAALTGMTILFAVIWFSQPAERPSKESARPWGWGFLSFFLASALTIAAVNPQGRLPWNKREVYIEIETRSGKPLLYQKLPAPPEALITGSSVSFLMPMDYFQSRWGLTAFNFSLNGGGSADFVNILRTVRRIRPDEAPPYLVIAEISNLRLANSGTNLTPLEYIRDMYSPRLQADALAQLFKDAYRVNQLSDSVFTLAIVDAGRWDSPMKAQSDGTFILLRDEGEKIYERRIKNNIPVLDQMKFCESLEEEGKRSVEELVALSREMRFGLALYAPPINDDFYKFTGYPKSRHDPCIKLFDEFMSGIAEENPNVFFKDLSRYEEISSRGMELYRDTHHLKPEGHRLMLDALAEEIGAAIDWARENRPPVP